ncbi:helix-turn-helix domain-containing protein [Clostridium sp. SYSU_GA19001]|uniref:PucR family transcriptional regulator n=1 Tax=Clostridium caldaquaticum TaxID=2940653 RepID=UPI0020776AC5|nr:helix-turn-helix domain-containing protein [Clostridium caldaquaticum]MCM8711240.1 helix-turn-helix domain-containing protein [Clostridium caldaquaticum]
MELNIGTLISKIKQYKFELYLSLGEQIPIKSIKLLPINSLNFDPNVLYITKASDLLHVLPINNPVNIICVSDCSLKLDTYDCYQLNLIIINNVDIIELFNYIQDILLSHQRLTVDSANLFTALVEDKGIQHIIDISYKILGNPIHVSDLSHKILAFTKNINVDDPIWYELTTTGYGSFSHISRGNSIGLYEKVRKSNYPFSTFIEESKIHVLHSNILIDNKPVGYITVPCYFKPYSEEDFEILALLSKVISMEMQKNKFFKNSRGIIYEYFIKDLLDGNLQDSSAVNERIKYLDLNLEDNIYVLTIRSNMPIDGNMTFTDIMGLVSNLQGYSKSIFYNDAIVIILSRKKKIFNLFNDLNGIIQLLNKHKLTAGISSCFHQLTHLRKYYDQSLKAIEIGTHLEKDKLFYNYEDYMIYDFMSICSLSEDIMSFCHPSIFVLLEYDEKHGTNFLESLYVYLYNDKNLVVSANSLHIHRNTLSYRIEKISEIMNLDLNDKDISFHLQFSFKILMFKKATSNNNSKYVNLTFM